MAILGEGPGDVYFLGQLIRFLSRQPVELELYTAAGWPRMKGLIQPTLRKAFHGGSNMVVIGLDVDDSDWNSARSTFERQLEVKREIESALARLPFNVLVAAAVPSREAWLDFLTGGPSSEASWQQRDRRRPGKLLRRELKKKVYGSERPDRATEMTVIEEAILQLPNRCQDLHRHFPGGLGPLFDYFSSAWTMPQPAPPDLS